MNASWDRDIKGKERLVKVNATRVKFRAVSSPAGLRQTDESQPFLDDDTPGDKKLARF